MKRSEKLQILCDVLGQKAYSLFLNEKGRGEFLGADDNCKTYFWIEGDFDLAAFERVVRSAKSKGFRHPAICPIFVICTGMVTYQPESRVRVVRLADIKANMVIA